MTDFPERAETALADPVLRANLGRATATIRARREAVVAQVPEWEQLRLRAQEIKDHTLANLDAYLLQFEEEATRRGAVVHWAGDAGEACRIVVSLAAAAGADVVVKAKSLTSDEIGLNLALEGAGIRPVETDLAELIVQLAGDRQSHILVPAIHKNRSEIRDLFNRHIGAGLETDDPAALAEAARTYLREAMLHASVGISGANFGVAETGALCVVESEGNARMCTTLPRTLISVVGIEKLIPRWEHLPVFLRLLARSATAEPLSPYTSVWAGTAADGPREMHVVLVDNGRTNVLEAELGRQALRCIRCSACLNVCPVYSRTGGHAYESIYPGPIGAILAPQLERLERHRSLPYASTLCGACYDVCPVRIDIPAILVDLRRRIVEHERRGSSWGFGMAVAGFVMRGRRRYAAGLRLMRVGTRLGLPKLLRAGRTWSSARTLPCVPHLTFRRWWRRR